MERNVQQLELRRGLASLPDDAELNRILKYQTRIDRGLYRNLQELQRLQAGRQEEHPLLPAAVDVTVDVFFRSWGMPFDSTRLDRYHVNETHELVMEVDGDVSDEWGEHVFRDGEQIEIIYRERA